MKNNFITLERIFKTGLVNFVRNASLSIAATAVMVVTLTIVLFSVVANATFTNTIAQINEKIDISVYLKDSVTEKQRNQLVDQLEGLQNVKSVEYLSKEKVLDRYREQNKDDLDLLLAVSQADENPLPATIRIKPVDPAKNSDIKTVLETPEVKKLQSDETSYSGDRQQNIDEITKSTSFFRKAIFASALIFAVISMLIIFNTIQMAIFNRRDELTIMRLLGAGTWYIRGPFIVETMLYGVIAAIISISACNFLLVAQSKAFGTSSLSLLDIGYANDYFARYFWVFFAIQLVAGMLIGALSALIATKRYLRFHYDHPPRRFRRKSS